MRSFFYRIKEPLKNIFFGIAGVVVLVAIVAIGILGLQGIGYIYEAFLPDWVRGAIGMSLLAGMGIALSLKFFSWFGEKIRDDWAKIHSSSSTPW